jgi:hypothetical protein
MNKSSFGPFDLMTSYISPFTTEKEARVVEKKLIKLLKCDEKFSPYKLNEPTGFYWGSIGASEWFNSELLKNAMQGLMEMSPRDHLITVDSIHNFINQEVNEAN